jgi:hypothetical protein
VVQALTDFVTSWDFSWRRCHFCGQQMDTGLEMVLGTLAAEACLVHEASVYAERDAQARTSLPYPRTYLGNMC